MNTDQNENEKGGRGNLTHVVVIVVIAIIAIGVLLANGSLDFTNLVVKLHGG